jgi:hypothetical protein
VTKLFVPGEACPSTWTSARNVNALQSLMEALRTSVAEYDSRITVERGTTLKSRAQALLHHLDTMLAGAVE